jgi:YfiH family protein
MPQTVESTPPFGGILAVGAEELPRARALRLVVDEEALGRGILVGFTDRDGGVSTGRFASLNLSGSVGDRLEDVIENRLRVAAAAGVDPASLRFCRQVHGTVIRPVDRFDHAGSDTADGMVTSSTGLVLGLLTADCAPIVLVGDRRVGVVHAGWRGLAQGIVEEGVAAVGPVWRAWVGPAIGACCYQVGQDLIDAFRARGLPVGRGRADIREAARAALLRAGVRRVQVMHTCTSCDRQYFSYRRDGLTGRQGTFVSILGRQRS